MNRAFQKDILRLIKATKGRFLSLTAIVTIGVAFFVGVSAVSTIMAYSVDRYNDDNSLKDITVYSGFGFDDQDVRDLESLEEVALAEPAQFVDTIGSVGSLTMITRIHSYDQNAVINRVVLKSGRMPERPDEALAENGTELIQGFSLGSKVVLTRPDDDLEDWLITDTFTVVGTIDTPVYLNETKENSTLSNRYIDTYLYVPQEAFVPEYWTEVNLLIRDGKKYNSFTDAYTSYDKSVKEAVRRLAATRESRRRDQLVEDAWDEYNEGYQEYLDGRQEYEEKIADAEKEIADAEKEIQDGEKELADGVKKLKDAEEELEKARKEGEQKIADGWAEVSKSEGLLAEGQAKLDEQKKELQKTLDELDELLPVLEILEGEDIQQLADALESLPEEVLSRPVEDLDELLKEYQELAKELHEAFPDADLSDPEQIIEGYEQAESVTRESLAVLKSEENLANAEALRNFDGEDSAADHPEAQALIDSMNSLSPVPLTLNTVADVLNAYDSMVAALETAERDLSRPEVQKAVEDLKNGGELPDLTALENISTEDIDQLITALETLSGKKIVTIKDLLDAIREADVYVKKVKDARKQITDGLADAQREIDEAAAEIEKAKEKLINASVQLEEELAKARQEIADGWQEIEENRQKLKDGKQELADAKEELEDARIDGQKELNDAKADLDKAKQEIEDLAEGKWTVLDRSQHYASETYYNTVKQMKAIANIFPVFFLLVAALVCLTTMTRMVAEQRGQIGIMRALGYSRFKCAEKYLVYAGAATLIGVILGSISGIAVFPAVIYHTWRMMYILPQMRIRIPWGLILLTSVIFLTMMEMTTWYACRADMTEVPSQLLRPKAPKLGRRTLIERIPFIWKQFSFSWKIVIRNLFRYRQRFIMTVIGVAGCTALLVTGFGISDSINAMVDIQFYEIMKTDGLARFADDTPASAARRIYNEVQKNEHAEAVTLAGSYNAKVYNAEEKDETVTAEIFRDSAQAAEIYNLRQRTDHQELILPEDGVIINERLSENLGVSVGDTLTMESFNGVRRDVKISGIMEYYIYHYVLMSEDYYREVFGTDMARNTLFVKAAGDADLLQSDLVKYEEISDVEFVNAVLENFRTMVKGIDAVVWVLIISSMSLAFVVLSNLTNVNISERQREIATLKVLGFRRREVENYIFRENNILTLLGALAGIPVGQILHRYIMGEVEMSYVMFGRRVFPRSNLYSVLLTLLFGIIVNRVLRKKLHEIEMVESLKSVE